MGRRPGWMVTQTGRPAMRSPGRPPIQRDVERAFWLKIAEGLTSEDAAIATIIPGEHWRWPRLRHCHDRVDGGDRASTAGF